MRRAVPFLLASLLLPLLPPASAQGGDAPVLLPDQGSEVPPAFEPVWVAHPFVDELFASTGGARTKQIDVPNKVFNRVFLTFESRPNQPNGDPWDRLFMVAIGGTQVLHGTTPRARFDLREDLTEYITLLPRGGKANVSLDLSSYAADGLFASVHIEFYLDAVGRALGDQPADVVVSPFRWWWVGGPGSTITAPVTFPATAPKGATVELFTSGHYPEGEFWYQRILVEREAPTFHIYVDGTEVGTVYAMPYVYAFLGIGGSPVYNDFVHPVMWWTAQQALDRAGIHGGTGEIPAYRAELSAELLPLLTGARTVSLVKENHLGLWPVSVSFLLDT